MDGAGIVHVCGGSSDDSAGQRARRRCEPPLPPHMLLPRSGRVKQSAAVLDGSIPASYQRVRGWPGMTRRASTAALGFTVLLSVLGPPRAVQGQQIASMRARSYMRFGYGSQYKAYYDDQVQVRDNRFTFFDSTSQGFKTAAGLTGSNTQAELDAIVKGASFMSLREDSTRPLHNVAGVGITLQAFVRIRDVRVLLAPSQPDDPATRVGGSFFRLPLMGNLLHAGPNSVPGGYQLACAWDNGPKCCAEAYTVASVDDPDNKIVSACVSIAPMLLTADENVQSGEVESGWFHITGFFQGGVVRVMVNESSAYYSQSTYSASASAGPRTAGDSIRPYNQPATFWLAASLPFRSNGDLDIGFTDRRYLFLRCDIDELKIWVKSSGRLLRDTAENFRDTYEGVHTCPMRDPQGLVLYIRERQGPASNGTVRFPASNAPESQLEQTGAQSYLLPLRNTGMVAVRVDDTNNAYYLQCPSNLRENYKHYRACAQTYVDRRAVATSSMTSTGVNLDSKFMWDAFRDARQDGSDVVDLWNFSPDTGVGSARVVFKDHNFNDQVRLGARMFSTRPDGGFFVALDYDFDVEQFTTGLPFYNIARNPGGSLRKLDDFRTLGRGIPQRDPVDGQIWNGQFNPNINDDPGCVRQTATRSNCDGIMINLNLSMPEPWTGAGNATWQTVCPTAFMENRIDPQYRFLCTEWWVPYGRGWPFRVEFNELPCASSDLFITVYRAKIGYEARPEWYSAAEAPSKHASDGADAGVRSLAECPNPDTVIWTQVGKAVVQFFRARDRNKDDAVDIVPADDPGLPNGAQLLPELPNRAENVTLTDTVKPRLYQRVFRFTPVPSQVDLTYRVCMKAKSYRHEATPLQFQVNSQGLYEAQLGNTIETMPYQTCDAATKAAGKCPPTMWMDRCIFVKVYPPQVEFGCSTVLDNQHCNPDDYLSGGRLAEGATLEFTAGDSGCSERVEIEGDDRWVCPDAANGSSCPPEYIVNISLDRATSNVPESFKLLPEGAAEKKYVSWTPTAGKDETLEGYQACFIAADTYGISKARRCFTVRVRKCKYCLHADETLSDIGKRYQVDWLQIYMANPHIATPDNVPRSLATINTGVHYDVRAGDYLELIAQRFFMTLSQLRLLNPDIPNDGFLQAGMNLCIMPPVCDVKCLYGTDCHIY